MTGPGKKDTLSSGFECQLPEQTGGAEKATVSHRVLECPSLSIRLSMLVLGATSFSVGLHRVSWNWEGENFIHCPLLLAEWPKSESQVIFPGTFPCAYRTQGA